MAVTIIPLGLNSTLKMIADTDADNTAERDVADGGATIYAVYIDNSANAAATSYIKFYDDANPTVGTTAPTMILPAYNAEKVTYVFKGGLTAFATSISYAGLTAAGTAGTTSPTSNVIVWIFCE